nr:unnamed protein product [Spirometra erinaceieuropaei]
MDFASKIFIVLSPQLEEAKLCDGITELQLQNYLIPFLPLSFLVDDDFIAGFCHRGVVDIIPLAHHNDLEVFVRKNMLTINMSASVYSAFGLAGVKFMCNNRKMYRKSLHLHPLFNTSFN